MSDETPPDDSLPADDPDAVPAEDSISAGETVEGTDVAEGVAEKDEPVVVTAEAEPSTDEVVDVQPASAEPVPELLYDTPISRSRGQVVLHPSREEYVELVRRLREEGYWSCVDLCAVDYLGYDADRALPPGTVAERFEVVVMLVDHRNRARIRVRVQVPADDPTLPTLFGIHPSVENPEREAFDMFGIVFDGHPDLSRILMPDEWEGHPLRKDSAVGRIPVQFKGTASGH